MGRKPRPDPGASEQVHGDASTRKRQKEQHQIPENEGLVKQKAREADSLDADEDREEAIQRGRSV